MKLEHVEDIMVVLRTSITKTQKYLYYIEILLQNLKTISI